MDELPISIISNDLKYTLSSLKIKTLEKARQYHHNKSFGGARLGDSNRGLTGNSQPMVDNSQLQSTGIGDKLQKIKKYLNKYDTVKDEVLRKINKAIDVQEQISQEQNNSSDRRQPELLNLDGNTFVNGDKERIYTQTQTQSAQMQTQSLTQTQSLQYNNSFIKTNVQKSQSKLEPLFPSSLNNSVPPSNIKKQIPIPQSTKSAIFQFLNQQQQSQQQLQIQLSSKANIFDKNPQFSDNQNSIPQTKHQQYRRIIEELQQQNDQSEDLQSGQMKIKGQIRQKIQYGLERGLTHTQSINIERTQSVDRSSDNLLQNTFQSQVELNCNNSHQRIVLRPNPKNIFQKSLVDNSIVEICGAKGVGKTALLLYFCQKFSQTSNKRVYFINCASGLSYKRFERLNRTCPNLQYRDSYILDHVLAVCKSTLSDPEVGCIVVDSLTNLLMQQQKTLIFLIKLFKIFSSLLHRNGGCKIILSNYIQQWFQNKEDQFLTNHYSYYSSVTSEFLKYKYFLKRWPRSDKVLIKMIRGGFIEGQYTIKQDGVDWVKINDGTNNSMSNQID